jgi:hypothetical protein
VGAAGRSSALALCLPGLVFAPLTIEINTIMRTSQIAQFTPVRRVGWLPRKRAARPGRLGSDTTVLSERIL